MGAQSAFQKDQHFLLVIFRHVHQLPHKRHNIGRSGRDARSARASRYGVVVIDRQFRRIHCVHVPMVKLLLGGVAQARRPVRQNARVIRSAVDAQFIGGEPDFERQFMQPRKLHPAKAGDV
jgi:hypothetical protein